MSSNLVAIERVRDPSRADFDALLLHDTPVVLEGVVDAWRARETWTPDYLAARLGELPIVVKTSSDHRHPDFDALRADWQRPAVQRVVGQIADRLAGRRRDDRVRMRFAELIKRLTTSSEAFRYVVGAEELVLCEAGRWNAQFEALRADFELPGFVPRDRLTSAAMWLSARGVRSHLHYDGDSLHNLNAQVRGSKHVQLYSPAELGKIYPYLFTKRRPHTFSQVDVENVDHARFPLFSSLGGYEGTLNAGDLLLIPAYWFHTFKPLGEFNVNVNFWWRAEHVRLTPVSAREYLGGVSMEMLRASPVPPVWLAGWFGKLERRITEDMSAARDRNRERSDN